MNVRILMCLAAAVAAAGCGRKEKTAAEPAVVKPPAVARALWVRTAEPLGQAIPRTELRGFCKERQVNTLYFYVGDFPDQQYNPEYITQLSIFVRSMHADGLRVVALYGNTDQARMARRENHYEAVTLVRDFLKYNHQQSPEERFDGLLMEILPDRLPEWTANEGGIQEAFADLVVELQRTVLEFDTGLPLGWVLPAGFGAFPGLATVFDAIDFAVLLTFQDNPATIVEQARTELNLAADKGRKVILAVETEDVEGRGEGFNRNTFHEEGAVQMETVLKEVASVFKAHPAFGGFAIHQYESFKELPPSREASAQE
jgi:hypothetical protein